MGPKPGSLASPPPLVPWKLWYTLVAVQLLLMVDSTQANRRLQHQLASKQRRLQAFCDHTNTPRHAPPVQSFLVSDGSWVDCIPIEGQISAHHPALKDHVIQMRPSSPRGSSGQAQITTEVYPQLFAREHGGCPEGTIPVQRTDPNRPLLKKTPSPLSTKAATGSVAVTTHEYAVTGLPVSNKSYSGTHSVFSVNAPDLEDPARDFSLSQLWIVDGSYDDKTLSSIEVGWQKFPSSEHQNGTGEPLAPHLFVYWTADAYNQTGCYDLLCPGFVQTNNKTVIGGAMPDYTTLAQNAQFEIGVGFEVIYDPAFSHWALYLNNDPVGYWPSAIYNGGRLGGTANQVQWGGEVVFYKDAANTTAHSKTAMGSGAFPDVGYPVAAYHRNITYVDADGNYLDAMPSVLEKGRLFDNPLCYNISIQQGGITNWGTYFFFGGSGGNNPGCLGKP